MAITNTTTKKIYDRLIKAGMTPAGAAGMLGNLYAESGAVANKVENLCLKRLRERGRVYTDETYTADVDAGKITKTEFLNPLPGSVYGYGLVQWTTVNRKAGLYDLCKSKKVSIGDLDTQIDYLLEELQKNFPSVWNILKTTTDVRTASDTVLKRFEMPADTGTSVQQTRYGFAKIFCDAYAPKTAVTAETLLNIYRSWIGCNEHDGSHRKIIDIYNGYKPWARGYKVGYKDDWCDACLSAAFIKAGAVSLIGGTECGVWEHVRIFKSAGIWIGKVRPVTGDIIVFDWQQDGVGDHIGIVEKIEGNTVTTLEGNYQDSVARRVLAWNDSRIAGYARPKYGAGEVVASQSADCFDAKLAGTYEAKSALNIRDGAGSSKYPVIGKMPAGHKVQCYGYYSLNGKAKWLYVQTTIDGIKYTGFCSAGSLKKI